MNYSLLKAIATGIFLSLSLMGCHSPADITGELTDIENSTETVYLIKPGNLRSVAATYFGEVIDSAHVDANGSFSFSNLPETNEPVLLELAIGVHGKAPNFLETDNPTQSNFMPIVWQTGEHLNIVTSSKAFQKNFSLKGPSEVNQALLQLRDIHQQAFQTYLAHKNWQVKDGSELMAKEDALRNYQQALMDFANQTPHLLPALVALRLVSPENIYERIPEFLVDQCAKWRKNEPQHPWVNQLCKEAERANLPVLLGDVFPNLTLPLLAGDSTFVYNRLGEKLTIIDLWASWCAPCRKENKNVLAPLWDTYSKQGFQIIAYALESDANSWRKAIEADGADRWTQASDLQGDAPPFLKQLRIRTIPANFILDQDGVVIAKNLHGQELKNFIADYLDEDSSDR